MMTAETTTARRGYFGVYGGRFVSELLIGVLEEIEQAFYDAQVDPAFLSRLATLLKEYVGRPTPIYPARQLSQHLGIDLYLKREDLAHTGAHKINNALGQGLLAERMGRRRVIAETGAGMHGVATATAAAMLGLDCVVYMGSDDVVRQHANVQRMRLLGAQVQPVDSGSRTLKDAINEAMRDWAANVDSTFYIFGTVAGPHPYPLIAREFQSVIGREARSQMLELTGRLPADVVACVGGGSNAMGIFAAFLDDAAVRLTGVEAAGRGLDSGAHAATLVAGTVGVLHGARSYLLQTPDGQVMETHSISAGLDYPGVGPEHSALKDSGRARYVAVTDQQVIDAFTLLARREGILPALESSHALAWVVEVAAQLRDGPVLINLSGRGDKDMPTVLRALGMEE
ncbi:MAG TPA: tryptophan synthase subunit beta [Chloroflexota bacterium]|jgi:tryptophan synthase beta chain|nr:tryptophan synthase subunit beta [Chloroflexota bacterium]